MICFISVGLAEPDEFTDATDNTDDVEIDIDDYELSNDPSPSNDDHDKPDIDINIFNARRNSKKQHGAAHRSITL